MHGYSRLTLIAGLVGVASLVATVYLSYELGRYQAGYAIMDVRRVATERQDLISEQVRRIEELERQVAILETAREVDRETYAQVESNLKQLEEQIQTQEEQLAFYQGIVSPEDGASGVRIQDFSIAPGLGERDYSIRLVLVQAIVHSQRVTGSVRLTVTGRRDDGEPVTLDLPTLGVADGRTEVGYGFRYFQAFGFDVTLPIGFTPDGVEVEVEPETPSGPVLSESYVWAQQ